MRWMLPIAVIAALVLGVAVPTDGWANPGDNSIKYDPSPNTVPQVNKILAHGTYSLAPQWEVRSITLKCQPVGGGTIRKNLASKQGGAWAAVLSPVAPGTYNVWAEMEFSTPAGGTGTVGTANAVATVTSN